MYRRWKESKQMDRKLNYFSPMNIYLSIICLYLIVSVPLSYSHFLPCSFYLFFCRSQTAMSFTNSDIFLLQHREIGNENETIDWGKITRRPVLNVVLFIAKITAKAAPILFCRLYFVSLQTLLSIRFKRKFADKWDRRWNKKILLYFFMLHDLRSSVAFSNWESWYTQKCEFMAFVGVANSELIQNVLSMLTSMCIHTYMCSNV